MTAGRIASAVSAADADRASLKTFGSNERIHVGDAGLLLIAKEF